MSRGTIVTSNRLRRFATILLGTVALIFVTTAASNAAAQCMTSGRSCGGNSPSNDGRCCAGMVCGTTACCTAGCRINNTLYSSGAANPQNPCQTCQPSVSTTSWTNKSPGTTCNDNNACTTQDKCQAGTCSGTALSCDDHNSCTQDSCDPVRGCVRQNLTGSCDDGNACTLGDTCSYGTCRAGTGRLTCNDYNACTNDSCDPSRGCVYTNNTNSCSDGNACTVGDKCGGGSCRPGTGTLSCSDSNACTDDWCDPTLGCKHSNNTSACSDGNPCTVGDACSGGYCRPGGPNSCDDNNPCTNDTCDRYYAGGCKHTNNTGPCSDGNACTVGDKCSYGACKPGTGVPYCDDHDACTRDVCYPATGCGHEPIRCDDYNACTRDACDPARGCVYEPVSCDDHNACTREVCDPTVGCVYAHVNCDDSNACTRDVCDPATGCGHEPIRCDDHNACTRDVCDPAVGCVYAPVDCDDSNACTRDVCNAATGCAHEPVSCDDFNACTRDVCYPGRGCVNEPVSCDDHNACTVDRCNADIGCIYAEILCNDNNSCTDDTCDPATGCVYTPDDTNSCADGALLCVTDSCVNGHCVSTPTVCDDHDPCTDDICDPASGQCVYTPDDTNSCTDDNACTADACVAGNCVSGPPTVVGSSDPIVILDSTTAVPYPSTITIPSVGGRVASVEVTINGLTHTFPDDLDLLLVGPTGANATIMSDAGGGGDVSNITLTLRDSAATPLPDTGLLASGSYQPANYEGLDGFPAPAPAPSGASALSVFNGTAPAGTWSLYVVDDAGADTGTITSWSLRIVLDPCDDGNACTDDSCDPASGCVYTPNSNPCSDGNLCTLGDTCSDGSCQPGGAVRDCDDGDVCSDDACDPAQGCVYTPNTAACSDDNPCTVGDECFARVCQPGTDVLECDDASTCTVDSCDPMSGCVHTPLECSFCSKHASVVVFDNRDWVSDASDYVQASLSSLGHVVTTFTDIDAGSINAALAGKQVLLIPEQKIVSFENELHRVLAQDPPAITALQNFVAGGGGFIIHGSIFNLDHAFLEDVFGINVDGVFGFNGTWSLNSADALGTAFCREIPNSIDSSDDVVAGVVNIASVPVGGKVIYILDDHSVVTLLPYGAGEIVVLGWNWDNAAPLGANDGGWLDVLDRAVNQVAKLTTFTASPGAAIPDAGYNGGFNVPGQTCSVIDTNSLPAGSTVHHVDVDIDITHTWVGDLVIKLQSPDGSILGIVSRPGTVDSDDGTTAGLGEDSNWGVSLKFSDTGPASAEDMGQTPVDLADGEVICMDGGTPCHYTPAPGSVATPPSTFADFIGENLRGTWTLCVGDAAGADTGTLNSWSLTVH